MMKLCPFGSHRVVSPLGTLPQAAQKLNNTMPMQANEMAIAVETLNVDSASFTQIKNACGGDENRMAAMIMDIVADQGKLQNPVTGSGGMLLGRVSDKGADFPGDIQIGDPVATLVSLSLTPLHIRKIKKIHMNTDQVDVEADAILFETGIYAKIPQDMDRKVVLSALDVAGAPAQTAKLVKPGDSVMILGASGKSGVLCAAQARISAGEEGNIIGVCYDPAETEELKTLQVCDHIIMADARQPLEVYHKVLKANGGEKVDVSINVVNVPDAEMALILPTRDGGTCYFFSMATSFSKAALGAEGVASAANMLIGNGYTSGHADFTLNLLRQSPALFELFKKRYGGKD
ncbi:MAG: L-erythro-3,5-diaminohexanoate dehydrogenase [Christensenellales bacterium]|jgi:L-erythro-3,5-diaminohexanoate dehydrogenase